MPRGWYYEQEEDIDPGSRQQRERAKPGDGNNKNSAAVVFNGGVGEQVELAITEIKSKIGTEGLGYLLDGVSPHEEEVMPCDNPGMRPQRRRAAWKSKPLGVVMAEASKVSAKEAEAAASAVKVKKYVARLAASVTGTGALKQHGQEGYLSPNSARRARKLCNRHKKVIVKFETETPAREAQESAEATPAAHRTTIDDSISMRTAGFDNGNASGDNGLNCAIGHADAVAQWEIQREDYILAKKGNDARGARCRMWDKDMNKAWYIVQSMLGQAPQRVTAPAAGRYDICEALDLLRGTYHAKSNLGVVQRVLEFILADWDHSLDDNQNVEEFNRRLEMITKEPALGGVGDKITMKDLAAALWIRNLGGVEHHKQHRQALLRDDIADLDKAQQKLMNEHAADRIGDDEPRGGGDKGRGRDRARERRGDRPGRDQEAQQKPMNEHDTTGSSDDGGSEPPTPPRGKGAKGNKYNRSNVKGIAKEVIAMLRRGDDTTDDSDDGGPEPPTPIQGVQHHD
jgi:hypothetical protein